MKTVRNVFVQVIEKPQRKVLIKRGINAADYFTYCEEVDCDVWGLLTSIPSIQGKPFAEDYCEAIEEVQASIAKYDPAVIEAQWDTSNPRIQLEPIGTRGDIELIPIK